MPLKIIRTKLVKNNLTDIKFSYIQNVRKATYGKRLKMYPIFSTSFEKAIPELKLVDNFFVLQIETKLFLFQKMTNLSALLYKGKF